MENAHGDIKEIVNASEAWKVLDKNFKPRRSGFLNGTFQKLADLKLVDCKSFADHVSQSCNVVNKSRNFSTKRKLDEHWPSFRFRSNLFSKHSAYSEAHAQERDPFDHSQILHKQF